MTKISFIAREDGNPVNLISIANKALIEDNRKDEAFEMMTKAFNSKSYGDALRIISEYCEITIQETNVNIEI